MARLGLQQRRLRSRQARLPLAQRGGERCCARLSLQ
jgi:hypothetical protein